MRPPARASKAMRASSCRIWPSARTSPDFLRECWRTADGKTVTAPLPPGVDGHFGPELRRLVLALYHQGQVTVARLVTLLRGFGILISKRQVVRLLIARKQNFLDEARDVLRAGLTKAAWITVDDT